MTLLSSLGKTLLKGGKAVLTKLSTPEAQTALSLTPLGGITKAPKILGTAGKIASGVGKVGKFLFLGETPVKTVKKTAATLGLGAFALGGGGKLVIEGLKGVKKATEKTVEFFIPPPPKFPEVKPVGFIEGAFTPAPKKKAPLKDILETGGALVGAAAIGGLAGLALEKALEKDSALPVTPELPSTLPSSPFPAPLPLTQQTQVIGREAGLPARRRKKVKKALESPQITVRNQNIQIVGRYAS